MNHLLEELNRKIADDAKEFRLGIRAGEVTVRHCGCESCVKARWVMAIAPPNGTGRKPRVFSALNGWAISCAGLVEEWYADWREAIDGALTISQRLDDPR